MSDATNSDFAPGLLDKAQQQAIAVSTTSVLATIDRGTTFPASPNDKDEYCYVADATNGVVWRFKWNASAAKWEFIGGPPLSSEVTTDEATVSATYAALTTSGPAIILPFAGDFDVYIECSCYGSVNNDVRMSYDIGGTGAVDADGTYVQGQSGGVLFAARTRRKTLTAVTLTAKYREASGTTHFLNRVMCVTPVRK